MKRPCANGPVPLSPDCPRSPDGFGGVYPPSRSGCPVPAANTGISRQKTRRRGKGGGGDRALRCRSPAHKAPMLQNDASAPRAARPGPGIENLRVRIDDPVRVRRPAAREPEQSAIRSKARRIGRSVRPLRSAMRPQTTTAPASRPGHKVGTVTCAALGRRRRRKPEALVRSEALALTAEHHS